jgi:hypothetical protein
MQRHRSRLASFAVTTKKPTSTQPLETGAFFFAGLFVFVLSSRCCRSVFVFALQQFSWKSMQAAFGRPAGLSTARTIKPFPPVEMTPHGKTGTVFWSGFLKV